MRESFIIIILPLLVIAVRCSNVEKDSFNLYKDHMRARNRDASKIDPVVANPWDSYEPLQEYEYVNLPLWMSEYSKRAPNVLKKRSMKNSVMKLDAGPQKRTSKAALSLMLQSKDPEQTEEEYSCFAGK